jgi:hypothetical protein
VWEQQQQQRQWVAGLLQLTPTEAQQPAHRGAAPAPPAKYAACSARRTLSAYATLWLAAVSLLPFKQLGTFLHAFDKYIMSSPRTSTQSLEPGTPSGFEGFRVLGSTVNLP